MIKLKWKNAKRRVNELIPYEKNPRTLTERERQTLTDSIQEFDLVEVPAINLDGRIIAGHQRIKILALLGRQDELIDVRIPNRKLTDQEFKNYNIRSNANHASWDIDLLKNSGLDLPALGLELPELQAINPDLKPIIKTENITYFKKAYFLISVNIQDIHKIAELIEQAKKIEGVNVRSNSN